MDNNTIMNAAEPPVSYGVNTYADVMAYLHSITITPETMLSLSDQLRFEAHNLHISKALRRLDQLESLCYDWDGNGATPVDREVIANMHSVIKHSEDKDWNSWVISPESNGTLNITSKKQMSSISLGIKEFSFYSFSAEGEKTGSHLPFSPEAFVMTMRQIA